MSRFQKLSQTIWHCQYHIVWVPKYRFRILNGAVATEVSNCIRAFSERKDCKVIELNVQIDQFLPFRVCSLVGDGSTENLDI